MPDWLVPFPDLDRHATTEADWWPSAPEPTTQKDIERLRHVMRRLSTRDVLIMQLYAQGLSLTEISKRVSFTSHSGVHRRIVSTLEYLQGLAQLPFDPPADAVHDIVLDHWMQQGLTGSPVKAARIVSVWWDCNSQRGTATRSGVSKSGVQKYLTRLLKAQDIEGPLKDLQEAAIMLNALARSTRRDGDDAVLGVS